MHDAVSGTGIAGLSEIVPLATNSLFEDVVIGIVLALIVFAAYYRFILQPARRKQTTQSTETRSSGGDTRN